MSDNKSAADWAKELATNWEARAALPSRDLFVASHPDWNDPETWLRRAEIEISLFFAGLDMEWLAGVDVLELGCGSGRLAGLVRDAARSYTGYDIAAGMVKAAQQRCRDREGVRFFVGDGLDVPAEAQDRQYGLVLAVAVLIHCPRTVIATNIQNVWRHVQPGGQIRLSVLAVHNDPEGIVGPQDEVEKALETIVSEKQSVIANLSDEERRLAFDTYYMGERFRYAEMEPFLSELTGGEVALYRGDPGCIYAAITKP
jgi:SAM-dependent methyltransferase